jgi:dihydropteroate synthase
VGLRLRGREVVLGERTWIMGILNVTPDSFSDGGVDTSASAAVARGLAMFEAGADIVDVGGESTRPAGAARVSAAEEIARTVPVVEGLRQRCQGYLSIDTTKAEVARAALDAGADVVNDVSALAFDPEMAPLVARRGVPAVLMHLRGAFDQMHLSWHYGDLMGEICDELAARMARAEQAGVLRAQLILDPGIGFSKDASQSLEAIRKLGEMRDLGRPILAGPSRKSFIEKVLDRSVDRRLLGTAASVAACVLAGAHIVRVHDVGAMAEVARMSDAIAGEGR